MQVSKDFYEEFELDLTGTCNLSCPLCSRNYIHAQHMVHKNVRPLENIIKQLDTFPNLKRAYVAGQVSEPTLHPDFIKYIQYLKARGMMVEIFTNGSTRDAAFWEELGSVLDNDDAVHFTICGSTQELHEKYRVNSNLETVLQNAMSYKKSNKNNDYCQFIKFEYNKNDEDNVNKLNFSNHYTVNSEGDRIINSKVKTPDSNIKPEEIRDKTIKWLIKNRRKTGTLLCKSLEYKKIYISQDGNISACYTHFEYNPGEAFTGNIFDYTKIIDFNYPDCFACEKQTINKIEKFGLEFIC